MKPAADFRLLVRCGNTGRYLRAASCGLLFVILAAAAHAQQFFKSWTTKDGLPQNNVVSIAQTPDGYLWLATVDGLARFDGVRFKVFNKSNTPEIPNNRILSMFTDTAGRLWFNYPGDQTVVVYENGRFKAFEKGRDFKKDENPEPVANYYREHTRNLLRHPEMRFRAGDIEYIYEDGRFVPRPVQEERAFPSRVFTIDSRSVWVEDAGILYHVEGEKVMRYEKGAPLPFDPKQALPFDSAEKDGILWFVAVLYNNNQPYARLFSYKDGEFKVFPLLVGMSDIEFDAKGNLWLAFGDSESIRIDAATIALNDPANFPATKAPAVKAWKLFRDRDDNLWFGGQEGLHLINPDPALTVYSKESEPSIDNVYPIVQDAEGTIWFAAWTDNHLFSYRDGKFSSENGPLLSSLFVDSRARLWKGSLFGEVSYRENNKWVSLKKGIISTRELAFITEDKQGNMWFGTDSGLIRYTPDGSQIFRIDDGLPSNVVTSYLFTRAGELWIGTNNGVARMENGRFRAFTEKDGLAGNYARSFYEDAEGTIWIGGYDGGLTRYKNGEFAKITKRDGLFSDGVFVILEDDAGWFWINSNQGIYRVRRGELNDFADGKTESVTSVSYGPEDGLMDVEGNGGKQPAGLKAKDGKLWFPMAKGVAVIDPKTARLETAPPKILIEEARIDQNRFDIFAGGIRLEPNQAALEIDYTALGFVGAERMRFRYRLEGLDENWTEAGTRRTAYYSHLPYGEYTFRVIAANYDGEWNTEGATVKIVIVPPFYREWWVFALAALGFFGVISLFYFNRVRRLRALSDTQVEFSRRLIESQEIERRRIAAELHDSIGQSLAMIKNRAVFGAQTVADEAAKEHLDLITAQTAQTIGEVREISYNLRPYLLDRLGLTQAIKSLLNKFAENHELKIEAEIDDVNNLFSNEGEISIYRIIQESLNNVVKHAEAGKLEVSIRKTERALAISIKDDGKGFNSDSPPHADASKGGFGLLGISERVRMLGGSHSIESQPGSGTKVFIKIDLTKNTNITINGN